MVNREWQANGYWYDPVRTIGENPAELRFVDFFDWDELGMRDLQYARIRIVECSSQPHIVNRYALVDVRHVNFEALRP